MDIFFRRLIKERIISKSEISSDILNFLDDNKQVVDADWDDGQNRGLSVAYRILFYNTWFYIDYYLYDYEPPKDYNNYTEIELLAVIPITSWLRKRTFNLAVSTRYFNLKDNKRFTDHNKIYYIWCIWEVCNNYLHWPPEELLIDILSLL